MNTIKNFQDQRGFFTLFEPALFNIKRAYIVENFDTQTIRGFHFHEHEQKFVICLKGAAKVVKVKGKLQNKIVILDKTWEESIITNKIFEGVYIPNQYANGWKALVPNTQLLFFSSSTTNESMNDDYRINPFNYKHWEIKSW